MAIAKISELKPPDKYRKSIFLVGFRYFFAFFIVELLTQQLPKKCKNAEKF